MTAKQTKGEKYAAEVRASYDLNQSQELLVDLIADTTDAIAGSTDESEKRQQRVVLLRAIAALALPDVGAEGKPHQSLSSKKAQHAANARWSGGKG